MVDEEYTGNDRQDVVQAGRELADSHWKWISKVMEMMYKDAMLHGYVHGYEDATKKDIKEINDDLKLND